MDTNLLLAFLAGASHPHHAQAVSLLGQMDRGELRLIVEPVVVAECVWAARSALGRPRAAAAALLSDFLESDGFEVRDRPIVQRALRLQTERPRLDFADAWLAARALVSGPTRIASFDRDIDAIAGLDRISEPVAAGGEVDGPEPGPDRDGEPPASGVR